MKNETRICQNCKKEFVIESDDFNFYEKIKVPPPTWCPECRMIRRMIWRNERNLFRRADGRTGKMIFSTIPPSVTAPVYEITFWNSDEWDPTEYGRQYDFPRSFFEQFKELLYSVPWPSRGVINLVNSDYCANAGDLKNCYLCFNGNGLEGCSYVVGGWGSKDSLDLYQTRHAELSYEGYMIDESYRTLFSVNCEDCHEVWFSRNLVGCQNCFGCINLRNKSYHIFNKPYTKEAYKEYLSKLDLGSYQIIAELKQKVHDFWLRYPMRFTLGINNVNSTGEHIEHSKNVRESFMVHEAENLKYCQFLEGPAADSYDHTVWGQNSNLIYDSLQVGKNCERIRFSVGCWPASSDIEYSVFCRSSSDLFGCVGLKKKQYCIFNKQYSKEAYFALREKIIKHMNERPYVSETRNSKSEIRKIEYRYGEFFPPDFSPFAYNETIAQDFFPLTKEQAEAKGYLWREAERREYETTVNAADLPDHIKNVSDDIVKEIIKCSSCGRAYRIIPMEFAFLKRIGLPLPRLCVECRFKERFKFVNPPKFWKRKCECAGKTSNQRFDRPELTVEGQPDTSYQYENTAKHFHADSPCPNEFETSYAPEQPEIVYCESCYNAEAA